MKTNLLSQQTGIYSNANFKRLVKNKLSAFMYERLPKELGISLYKLNMIFKKPATATLKIVNAFADLLEMEAYELVLEYKLGYNRVTIAELDNLKEAS